jgi:hypothetical protein
LRTFLITLNLRKNGHFEEFSDPPKSPLERGDFEDFSDNPKSQEKWGV